MNKTDLVVAVVQARLSSTRLPRKVLRNVGGTTMLEEVLRRLTAAQSVDTTIVATSNSKEDDELVAFCAARNIPYVRGPLHDVLSRFMVAIDETGADVVVRVTSDCPLADPQLVDDVVEKLISSGADYAANRLVDQRSYPIGLDVEAIRSDAMRRADVEAKAPFEREHVTPYFYVGDNGFHVELTGRAHESANQRWTVDTPEDLQFVREIFQRLDGSMRWQDVLSIVERESELLEINSGVAQKSVYDVQKRDEDD